MPAYNSTYPITPYSLRYMDEQEDLRRLQEQQAANNVVAPYDAESAQIQAPYSPEFLDQREKLKQQLLERKRNNPALNDSLPKKFVSKKDKDGIPTTLPTQTKVPVQVSNPGRDSKIKDDNLGPSSVSPTVEAKPNPFYASSPSSSMPATGQQIGTVQPQAQGEDPRTMLYARLMNQYRNRDLQDQDMLKRMGEARDMSALYQLAPILNQASSKMGTLQGKRADVADMQPFIKALSERDMGPMMDEMRLRDQRDKDAYMQAQIAQKLASAQRQAGPGAQKPLPYYKPATKDSPGEILMYDRDGNVQARTLPPGYEPNNPWAMLPPMVNAAGQPSFYQQNPVTGETRKLELPDDLKLLSQIKTETSAQLKKIDQDIKVASEAERNALRREQARLSVRMGDIREKELMLKIKAQEEAGRKNRAKEKIEKAKLTAKTTPKPGALAKTSEGERTAGLQAKVAIDALSEIEKLEGKGYVPGARQIMAETVGKVSSTAGNLIASPDDQAYEIASKALLDQLLRAASGANAPESEVRRMWATYAIRPGDSEQAKAVKRKGRRTFVEGLIEKAGAAGVGKALPAPQGRKVLKKQYSPSRNQTKIIYSDGREEIVNGRQ